MKQAVEYETFMKELESLNLRFPVAELSRRLGYSKGTISKILQNKAEISNSFYEKFCETFFQKTPLLKVDNKKLTKMAEEPKNDNKDLYKMLLEEKDARRNDSEKMIKALESDKEKLYAVIESLNNIINNQLTNLNGTAHSILLVNRAANSVIFESLSKMQNLPPDELSTKAGNLELSFFDKMKGEGTLAGADKYNS